VKDAVRATDTAASRELAEAALGAPDGDAVRALVAGGALGGGPGDGDARDGRAG